MSRPTAAAMLVLLLLILAVPCAATAPERPAAAASPGIDAGYLQIRDLLSDDRKTRRQAAEKLVARGEQGLVFGIVDALFFIAKPFRGEALDTLEKLTGEKPGRGYWDWVELVGRLENVAPTPGYSDWKASLFSHLDPGYRRLLDPAAPSTLRLEEVVSGGVRIEGIPSIDDPALVSADQAEGMNDQEDVFGVVVGGEARAYPRRFLDWHEMLNDVIAGEPVTLSYCTLCGAAVFFRTTRPEGGAYRFATSGLLYRSNKLMFDRETGTLWSNLTGEPVLGPLVGRGLSLPILPQTRTTWGDWRKRHPQTKVIAVDKKLREIALQHGFDYRPGRADQARRGVDFPVWKKSDILPAKEEVFTLRLGAAAKAWPLEQLLAVGLLNDELGGQKIVLVADRETGAVRAFSRPDLKLRQGADPNELLDDQGGRYQIGEHELKPLAKDPGEGFARLPGHFAFWFGWYAFFPQTAVWLGPEGAGAAPP